MVAWPRKNLSDGGRKARRRLRHGLSPGLIAESARVGGLPRRAARRCHDFLSPRFAWRAVALDAGHVIQVPLLIVSGAVMLGLAAWILLLGPGGRLNRGFSLLLFAIGAGDLAHALWHLTEPETFWRRIQVYFNILVPASAIGFLFAYRRGVSRAPAHPWTAWLLWAATGAGVLYYALGREAWLTETAGATPTLKATLALGFLALSVVAAALLWDADRVSDPARRRALAITGVGFALYPWFVGLVSVGVGDLISVAPFSRPVGALLLLPFLVAFAAVAVAERRRSGLEAQRIARRFAGALSAPLVCAAIVTIVFFFNDRDRADRVLAAFVGVWTLSLPAVATFALFRHRLFNLEPRIKWTIRQGTVTAAFVAVFFVASEGSQIFFTQLRGSQWVGLLAAGLLLFFIHPLQRIAERFASASMPDAKPISGLTLDERRALFREHLVLAWADGTIGRKERLLLDHLADRLQLSSQEANGLETDVVHAGRAWR